MLPAVSEPLERLVGAVLRERVVATRDQPPFDRVTMDGIAFASDAFLNGRREFRIAGTQAAGAPQTTLPDPQACIEVMTGAMLPSGCDCVVPVEQITVESGVARLNDLAGRPDQYVGVPDRRNAVLDRALDSNPNVAGPKLDGGLPLRLG